MLFAQMLCVPQPPLKPLAYSTLMVRLLHNMPGCAPPSLSGPSPAGICLWTWVVRASLQGLHAWHLLHSVNIVYALTHYASSMSVVVATRPRTPVDAV